MKPYTLSLISYLLTIFTIMFGDMIHIYHAPLMLKYPLGLIIFSFQIWSIFWGIIGYCSRTPQRDYIITFFLGVLSLPMVFLAILMLGGDS